MGERIKTLRLEKNMSQEELAKCIGVTQATISDWENGVTHPKRINWIGLADFFGVTLNDFLPCKKNEHEKSLP